MTKYINFFPGNTQDTREIAVSDDAAYGMAADLGDFIDAMISGCTSSISLDGVKDAIEDGAVLGAIMDEYKLDEAALQEAVEDLHDAIR